jgi:hypothetical protein
MNASATLIDLYNLACAQLGGRFVIIPALRKRYMDVYTSVSVVIHKIIDALASKDDSLVLIRLNTAGFTKYVPAALQDITCTLRKWMDAASIDPVIESYAPPLSLPARWE